MRRPDAAAQQRVDEAAGKAGGVHGVTREQFEAIVRNDFLSFIQQTFNSLVPTDSLRMNWHIQALAYRLEQIRKGEITRLIINMPPRSLKSIVTSVAFPAFILGHSPSARLITLSYGSDLATKHANDFRLILNSQWYKGLFPATRISGVKNTEEEVATTRRGFRLSTSVGGTLTGRGGNIIVIDDPLKPEDALSESRRTRVNDWYTNTLLSRLDDKERGAIIVVMQRLHPEDLTGYLLRTSDEWTLLNLPAIAEQDVRVRIGANRFHRWRAGELLHPEALSKATLESLRRQMGSDAFSAQYLQDPIPPGGNIIKRHWIRRYDNPPIHIWSDSIIQSWDTASKEGGQNDWSVCSTWLVRDGKYYLIDVIRSRLNYPALKALALESARVHDPTKILVEDSGVGTSLAAELQAAGLPAVGVKVEGDKITRMAVQSAKFESGQVIFPKSAPWLEILETELFAFPGARHDDQVDSISQALGDEISGGYDTSMRWVTGE